MLEKNLNVLDICHCDVAQSLQLTDGARIMLHDVARVIKLALVIPASSATAERSFSSLRRLNTYIRSTMGQQRLNQLLLLNCHQERVDKLNVQRIAKEFVSKVEKRARFFGNFT